MDLITGPKLGGGGGVSGGSAKSPNLTFFFLKPSLRYSCIPNMILLIILDSFQRLVWGCGFQKDETLVLGLEACTKMNNYLKVTQVGLIRS